MSMKRRSFIKHTLVGGAVAAGSLALPQWVLGEWNKTAFEAKSIDEALNALLGSAAMEESSAVKIKAPDIAENGAVVPIQVDVEGLENIESIAIIAEKNPVPLVANFKCVGQGTSFVSTRIKMGKTSDVIAVVKAGGKLYSAKKEVKVTIGGCGG